jgi:hypothetical protein
VALNGVCRLPAARPSSVHSLDVASRRARPEVIARWSAPRSNRESARGVGVVPNCFRIRAPRFGGITTSEVRRASEGGRRASGLLTTTALIHAARNRLQSNSMRRTAEDGENRSTRKSLERWHFFGRRRGHSRELFSIEKWLPGERLTAGLVQMSIL